MSAGSVRTDRTRDEGRDDQEFGLRACSGSTQCGEREFIERCTQRSNLTTKESVATLPSLAFSGEQNSVRGDFVLGGFVRYPDILWYTFSCATVAIFDGLLFNLFNFMFFFVFRPCVQFRLLMETLAPFS